MKNPFKSLAIFFADVSAIREDQHKIAVSQQFIEETLKGLETSVNSLIDAKITPEEKEGPLPRTPKPLSPTQRRDAFIKSRQDPQFVSKLMSKKDAKPL